MAVLVNREVAFDEDTPCTCYVDDDGSEVCWKDGAVGVLSPEQKQRLCSAKVSKGEVPDEMQKRYDRFSRTVEVCKDWEKHGFDTYWDCMSKVNSREGQKNA